MAKNNKKSEIDEIVNEYYNILHSSRFKLWFIPLKVGKITEKYGTNPASVMVSCGLKIIITLMMVGVANGLFAKAVLKAEAIKGMDYMQVLWILGYTLVVCFLVKRIDSIFSQFR